MTEKLKLTTQLYMNYRVEGKFPTGTRHRMETFVDASDSLIEAFWRRHWMGGLCEKIRKCPADMVGEGSCFMVYIGVVAGRSLIDVKGNDQYNHAWVSLIADENDMTVRPTIQGVGGYVDDVIYLLNQLTYQMPVINPFRELGEFK